MTRDSDNPVPGANAMKTEKIAVVGLGYVGLPLAVEFARQGFEVVGLDVMEQRCADINQGISHVEDIDSDVLAKLAGKQEPGFIHATTDFSVLAEVDAVSICVPTPLVKTKDPDMSYILAVCEHLKKYVHAGMKIILESTTYPGTTEEILVPLVQEAGFEVGKDVFVAFSPERIDPGNETYQLKNTPKVIGGVTPECTKQVCALYESVIDTIVPVSNTKVAEMAKLLENTYRSVNIGMVNELAQMCGILGIDTNEVIHAAASKPFGFKAFYPGPGLGGHCIPIDPHYLSWKLKTLNYNARFIELASEINTNMPHYVVGLITDKLNEQKKSINGANILMMGISYKSNISDMRESPAIDIYRLLAKKGANISYCDPHVPSFVDTNQTVQAKELTPQLIAENDLVVITTWHREFSIEPIVENAKAIVDTRNATAGMADPKIIRI
jgi:UDP-N-acetyl-D-glucosamine dehydrogenase